MIRLSWATFRERWPLFVGAVVAVAVGVALVQASLLTLVSAARPTIPHGLPPDQELLLRDGYTGAVSLAGMMVGISAFVAVFIVASTFAFTVAQRRRDLALLRLIGAGRRQVRRLMFGEALVLGTLGSVAGIILGLLVAPVEVRLLARPGLVPADFHAEWRPWIIAVSLAVGTGISVAGSFSAARRAARVRPLESLRAVDGDRVMTPGRWVIGLLASAGALAMIVAATSMGGTGAMNMSIGISLVAVIALSALSPTVVPLVNRLLRLVSRVLFPRSRLSELVHANVADGVRRSASTAAPIILLVGLVAGLAGAVGVITAGAEREAQQTVDADLVVTTGARIGGQLAAVPHVRAVSEETPALVEVLERLDNGESDYAVVHAVAVDPDTYRQTHHVAEIAGDLGDLEGSTVALDTDYASVVHARLGGVVRIRVDGVAPRPDGRGGAALDAQRTRGPPPSAVRGRRNRQRLPRAHRPSGRRPRGRPGHPAPVERLVVGSGRPGHRADGHGLDRRGRRPAEQRAPLPADRDLGPGDAVHGDRDGERGRDRGGQPSCRVRRRAAHGHESVPGRPDGPVGVDGGGRRRGGPGWCGRHAHHRWGLGRCLGRRRLTREPAPVDHVRRAHPGRSRDRRGDQRDDRARRHATATDPGRSGQGVDVESAPVSVRVDRAVNPLGKAGHAADHGAMDDATHAIRVLVVDDQDPFRRAMSAVVEATEGFEVVGAVDSGEGSLAAVTDLGPDLVLMDVNLPGIDGIEAARRIGAGAAPPVVVLLSTYDEDEFDLSGCGAAAYISKAALSPARLTDVWSASGGPSPGEGSEHGRQPDPH